MDLLGAGGLGPFQNLFDLVDAASGAVQLIAENLVCRAGRQAEAAVHARPQDAVCRVALGRAADPVSEAGLHQVLNSRPRLKMLRGSKCCFRRRWIAETAVLRG